MGLDQSAVTATKRGFEPEIWTRGFDKIAKGDFGRRERVARRARAEGPSQSLPLRQPIGSYVEILIHSYDPSAVAGRILNRVLASPKEREPRLSLEQ